MKAASLSFLACMAFSSISYCNDDQQILFSAQAEGSFFEVRVDQANHEVEGKTQNTRKFLSIMIRKDDRAYLAARSAGKLFGILSEGLATNEANIYQINDRIIIKFTGPDQGIDIEFVVEGGRKLIFSVDRKGAINLRDKIGKFYWRIFSPKE